MKYNGTLMKIIISMKIMKVIIKSISSVKYQQRKHGENGNEMVKIIEMEIIEM
jgi:hypothetical protein